MPCHAIPCHTLNYIHIAFTTFLLQIVADHPDVAEVAVVGVHDELRGQVPVALFVKSSSAKHDNESIIRDLVGMLRMSIRAIANGDQEIRVPATIEDPAVLDEIKDALGWSKH